MVDNSNNNSSKPRNWRDRVGVKGGMPKLADEFKTESRDGARTARPNQPTGQPGQAAPAGNAGANRQAPKPVSKPAPMAPRRPLSSASRPPVRPPVRPLAGQEAPKPGVAARPHHGVGSQGGPTSEQSSAFAERLRAQRQAAEALAKKRAEETRNRLAGAASSNTGPKFSFADEELNEAAQEKRQQPAPPQHQAPQAPANSMARPSAVPPRRPTTGSRPAPATSPYQPSDAFRQSRGFNQYDERQPAPLAPTPGAPAPLAHDRYAEAPATDQRAYAPPANPGYRAPQSRDPYYADNASDDLFEDDGQAERSAPRRAGASDYSAAYRDYDDAFEYEEEPRSRGGIWVFVVLMLVVVAAIAAGAYWFINYGTKIGTKAPTAGNVPTVTAPEQPVKVAPKPEDTTPVPGAPVRRKKIYDRILGNQTLEPEKLVPSEETPQTPPPPAMVPESPPPGDAPLSVQPLPLPLPPPPTLPGVQGGLQENVPGAVNAKSNRVASLTPDSVVPGAGKTGQTVIAPTAAPQQSPTKPAGGQPAPLALPALPALERTGQPDANDTASPTSPDAAADAATSPAKALATPPLPRKKPIAVIASARQAAQQARLAALTRAVAPAPLTPRQPLGGSGPVQLIPGTAGSQNFNAPQPAHPGQFAAGQTAPTQGVPAPRQPNTNIASLPRPVQPAPAPQQSGVGGSGYVLQMSSFRDRDAATAEYRRLIGRHSSILRGLSPEIREADLGASGKFYKLRLGAVAGRGQAVQLCNALIAAGEKDCLVRNR